MNENVKIGNALSMGRLLEFESVFPNEQALSMHEYLRGGNRSIILNVAAYFLGFKPFNSKYHDNRELIGAIFSPENQDFADKVYTKVSVIERTGVKIAIINKYSSLKLFESFFNIEDAGQTQSNSDFEINLFKAYLVLNSEFTTAQRVAFTSTRDLGDIKFPAMLFCMDYPISDKSNFNINQIWTTQISKAIFLFQFLENEEKTKPLLSSFLAGFKCDSWKDYLKRLLPLTDSIIKQNKEGHIDIVITSGENFEESKYFLEKLIVKITDELNLYDFLTLRSKPFYKIDDGIYRIIFNLFVVEKIFKGAYFLLRDVNNTLQEGKIKDFRSFYGDNFSEKNLCYRVVESIYSIKCEKLSGKEFSEMKIDGAPDYYVRKGKNIILFESKDFLISVDKKMSFNYQTYKDEFQRVLYYEDLPNGKQKHKAVKQLIKNIRQILKKEFNAKKDYCYKDIFIYPIILTHDSQFDVPGFNELIDSWFQVELLALQTEGLFIHHVYSLTIVNIDTLIYNQIGLSKAILLHEVIKLYHEFKKSRPMEAFNDKQEMEQYFLSKMVPFSVFLDQYFVNNGLSQLPPILELIRPALFEEEVV
ncbi:MAG TPA: hypothetical protein PLN13_10305 [Bacteroidia bacterium]|nr:hypothetical protein [Bacteroidia bacterium]HRH08963.1 hypothetical protein [Bacteroidia bacterium]